MGAVIAITRWLRLDTGSWSRFARALSPVSAALVVVGAYLLFAFNRFGIQGLTEPRGAVRMVLVGFYGWLGLAVAIWALARVVSGSGVALGSIVRLVGQAHLPLLLVALTLQAFGVVLRILGPGLVAGLFAGLFWIPALLTAAVRAVGPAKLLPAFLVVVGPYLGWLVSVGRYLETQVGHLL